MCVIIWGGEELPFLEPGATSHSCNWSVRIKGNSRGGLVGEAAEKDALFFGSVIKKQQTETGAGICFKTRFCWIFNPSS